MYKNCVRGLLLLAAFAWTVESDCYADLTAAQSAWNTRLGIDPSLNWNNPPKLRESLEQAFLGKGEVATFKNVCSGHKAFKQALANNYSYMGCINPLRLVAYDNGTARGVSVHNARDYFAITVSFDFICGAGYSFFANNADCLGRQVFGQNHGGIESIFFSFWSNVEAIWNQEHAIDQTSAKAICDEIELAALNMPTKNIFGACGNIGLYFGCEYFRQSLQYHFTWCTQTDCSFTGQ